MSDVQSPTVQSFDSMNALRGLGALIVVAGHMDLRSVVPIGHAWMAVDMFFALSGFVIAHAYDPRFARGLGTFNFMVSRWIRLFPMLLMGAAFALLAELVGAREGPSFSAAELAAKSIAQLFALRFPTAQDSDVFDLNMPMYTLELEMIAYIVFALLWSPSRAWLLGIVALGAITVTLATLSEGSSDLGVDYPHPWYGLSRLAFAFFGGALMRRCWSGRRWRSPWSLLILPALVLVLGFDPGSAGVAWDLFGTLVLTPALIWACAHFEPPLRFSEPFRLAGELSYGVYAIHFPLLCMVLYWRHWKHGEIPTLPGIAFMLATVALTYALSRWLDAPLRRVLRARLQPGRRAPAATGALPSAEGRYRGTARQTTSFEVERANASVNANIIRNDD